MDFLDICVKKKTSNNRISDCVIRPRFLHTHSEDLVCKGGSFTAFYHDGVWDTSVNNLVRLVDDATYAKYQEMREQQPGLIADLQFMRYHDSNVMDEFARYTKVRESRDVDFDTTIFFNNDTPKKSDYSTTQLSYTPCEGPTPAFDELAGTLYEKSELDKILWIVGALLSNKMGQIQKFLYLYGSKGSGKGTMVNIIKDLLEDYWRPISLKLLTSGTEFATSQVQEKPCLIDEDTDLSRVTDDTWLLKLTSHESIRVNQKYRSPFEMSFHGLLIAASNQRYQVRNVDSGITRRALVVEPSNNKVPRQRYEELVALIKFETPHIAHKAIQTFNRLGYSFYDDYIDVEMIAFTDHIFEFVREYQRELGDPCTLRRATELYIQFLTDIGFDTKGAKRKIKQELGRYYNEFLNQTTIDGENYKNVFRGFRFDQIFPEVEQKEVEEGQSWLELRQQPSILDRIAADYPAQLTTKDGIPRKSWDDNHYTLKQIPTNELHFVQLPMNHIIIDFDLKDDMGNKDIVRNIEAASKFPPTYAELSKSGQGIHLHYIYDGDVTMLKALYEDNIEVKVFTGKQALRRKLTKCNNLPISTIASGLPIKEKGGGRVLSDVSNIVWNDKKLRRFVAKCLTKQYHENTKPSIDLLYKVLSDAYNQRVEYDIRDMYQDIVLFAMSSTNNVTYCLDKVGKMPLTTLEEVDISKFQTLSKVEDEDIVFFDIEVFPNLFVVSWMPNKEPYQVRTWVNPSPAQIEELCKSPLVGFNNRRYDNHILYARLIGEDNLKLFQQSQRIIQQKGNSAFYGGAYELSYTDIYDFSSKKQSLKKWEVELGINHVELDIPWDQPVEESLWETVVEYCENDVRATKAVFDACYNDFKARKILAELAGMSVNATNNQLSAKFLFGDDKRPQDKFNYVHLDELFPGYKYEFGKSTYRGEEVGEGGYVYAEPGTYTGVGLIDIQSMHPNSLIQMNYFGPYTQRYADLVQARLYIKHGDFESAGKLFDGALKPYLTDKSSAKALSYALKIIINSVYGMTAAKFENVFKHPDNIDNIVAKRGALFMIDLKHACQERGMKVVHIKTDSIKIANMTEEDLKFINDFGRQYGYDFEHEATYDKFALVNKAVYIAHDHEGWHATGSMFAEPFVHKTLFTKEPIENRDFHIVKEVSGAKIFLGGHFVGRLANVYASLSGDVMQRVKDDKSTAVTGTKGFKWRLASELEREGYKDIDMRYYNSLVDEAKKAIESVGDLSLIVS